jgi:hypothetical protein
MGTNLDKMPEPLLLKNQTGSFRSTGDGPKKKQSDSNMLSSWKSKGGDQHGITEYMFVEMAHNTDDDTVVLICVTNTDNFKVHEYKAEKLNDKNWQFII